MTTQEREMTKNPVYVPFIFNNKSALEKENKKLTEYKTCALECKDMYKVGMPDFVERIKNATTVGQVNSIVTTARHLM